MDRGASLYAAECAACHGMAGEGDGVMAKNFQDPSVADFTDFERMAEANTIILEGKIIRGGMGTGMPYWGAILEPQDIGALVNAIWRMTFDGEQ
ncbi:MAG: c-type cytochrome [Anaerolineales bacterium]|nr:c-type cytochrome [Anaerolineales bacterium]